MSVLVSGSIAFDYLLKFKDGNFSDHLLADQLNQLSVAFLTPHLDKQLGGCAGNICYNLQQLGINSAPIATIGKDFEPYQKWLNQLKLNCNFLVPIEDCYSAQAFIITDKNNNQITAFHPGAMSFADKSVLEDFSNLKVPLAIVAPNSLTAMINQAYQFSKNNIPFIFDPGQGLPMFNQDQLTKIIDQASFLIVNYYESELLNKKMGLNREQIASKLKALIITHSEKGSFVYYDNKTLEVKAVKVKKAIDPTGCGDAYRAGIVYGLLNNWDWQKTLQLANVIGAIKVQSQGTQNHLLDWHKISQIYQQTYQISFQP